jgi:hypothetical protein
MTRFHAALALAAALIVAGCYPPSTIRPVGTTTGLKQDAALTGLWKGTSAKGESGYFHFLPQDDGSFTVLLVAGGKGEKEWMLVTATTTQLGANRLMNARLVSSNGNPETGGPKGTFPVLYGIDGKGALTLALLDERKVKAALKAHQLAGTGYKTSLDDAIITAEPAALDRFLQTPAGAGLFDKPFFTLKKVE